MHPARLLAVLIVFLTLACSVQSQSTVADIAAKLRDQPLFLRGGWIEDNLAFDAAGKAMKDYKTGPPSVSGFRFDDAHLSGDHLLLTGVRVGLEVERSGTRRVVIPESGKKHAPDEKITVDIDGHGQTDFTPALKAIFTTEEREVPRVTLPSPGKVQPPCPAPDANALSAPAPEKPPCRPPFSHIGGSVKPPRLLKSPDPVFSEWARRLKYSGNVEVYVVVDEQGRPARVRVVRAVGLGLDEQAVAAVEGYHFAPAMQGDQPVPVDLYVEVNFQIF